MRSCARSVGLALLMAATQASADSCGLPQQGDGRVASVIDARTIRLDDGREVRLAGLAPLPADHAARAITTLKTLTGLTVTLHGATDAPDRYGRQTLLVIPAGAPRSIQADMLAQGVALANVTPTACAGSFMNAEAEAQRARRGIWRDRTVIKNAESPGDILVAVGHFALIEGRVQSVRSSGPLTYINFGRRWTQDFAVTMPVKASPVFAAAGKSPALFAGKRLRVRGFIERRGNANGGPGIAVTQPGQIEIVEAGERAAPSE